jgi:hypothetical protein
MYRTKHRRRRSPRWLTIPASVLEQLVSRHANRYHNRPVRLVGRVA